MTSVRSPVRERREEGHGLASPHELVERPDVTVPRAMRLRTNGVGLQLFEWPGADPAVFFAHATGFHARVWDATIARLPGRHCWAWDARGHGRSDKPAPPYRWSACADDLVGVIDQLGLHGAIGVGHSGGGHALVVAAARRPAAFAGLLLLDPVIFDPAMYGTPRDANHFAAKRRNQWTSPEEMFERFRARPPFDRWDPRVLRDYCVHGLLPAPDGAGFVLACPPEVEASIYGMALEGGDVWEAVARVDVPVRVLRARPREGPGDFDMGRSPTAPELAERFASGQDVFLPEMTHFIPMQDPELVARHLRELGA